MQTEYQHDLFTQQRTPTPAQAQSEPRSGVYQTEYGNACEYLKGASTAYDLDSRESIPAEVVRFDKWIREIE